MRAAADRFSRAGACADILNSGTDLIMISSHWTDTERVRWMMADLHESVRFGVLRREALEDSVRRMKRFA